MSSTACCFCRRLAGTDELDYRLFICVKCAARSHVLARSRPGGSSGYLELIRDDGRSENIETYMNWVGSDLDKICRSKAAKLNQALVEIAAGL
jgi:hypothetical protein